MKQTVTHKKLRPLQGLALIAAVIAALILINFLLGTFVQRLIGYGASSVLFWIIGAAIAYRLFRKYIAGCTYELTQDVLRLCRTYGKRERLICDIYLNRVLFTGTPDEAKKRFGRITAVRAMRPDDPAAVTAVVYDCADGRRMALIQANDDLKAALADRVRGK